MVVWIESELSFMRKQVLHSLRESSLAIGILIVSTGVGVVFKLWGLHESNVVVLYLFSVLLIARFTKGYFYGIAAAVFSLLLFNWFFTEPYFTLKVYDLTYLITFFIMMFTSIVTSALTTTAKQAVANREAAMQERYRSNLLRAISHDIRTPLSVIMGTSEVLMGATKEGAIQHALAKDIHRDAEWLHDMVENILNLTKLQDGKFSLEKHSEAVEEVVEAALMVMSKRLPERTIDVEMPKHVVMAPMDARLISQVLINLLDNAAKHTPAQAEIKLSVEEEETAVRFSVEDRGGGIPEGDLPYLFQLFYTTSIKGPDAKRNIGIGLTICQSIVEAHGGTIVAENRQDGGARFTFTLPLEGV